MRLLFVLGLALIAGTGCSDDDTPLAKPEGVTLADACADASTQALMNQCAAEDYAAADGELNRIYGKAIQSVSGDDEQRLRAAQRRWIPFRDAQCESEAAELEGGSLYTTVLNACLADLTRQRTEELRSYVETGGR